MYFKSVITHQAYCQLGQNLVILNLKTQESNEEIETQPSYIPTVLMNISGNHHTYYLPLRIHFTTSFYWKGRSAATAATILAHPLLNELVKENREHGNKV